MRYPKPSPHHSQDEQKLKKIGGVAAAFSRYPFKNIKIKNKMSRYLEDKRVMEADLLASQVAKQVRASGTEDEAVQAEFAAGRAMALERAKIRLEKAAAALEVMDPWEDRSAWLDAEMEVRVAKAELARIEKKITDGIEGLRRELAAIDAKVAAIHRGWAEQEVAS